MEHGSVVKGVLLSQTLRFNGRLAGVNVASRTPVYAIEPIDQVPQRPAHSAFEPSLSNSDLQCVSSLRDTFSTSHPNVICHLW